MKMQRVFKLNTLQFLICLEQAGTFKVCDTNVIMLEILQEMGYVSFKGKPAGLIAVLTRKGRKAIDEALATL
jgi:hypothetical protein